MPHPAPIKVAVLDDYQNVALEMADWSTLPPHVQIRVFHDTVTDPEQLIERLAPFDVVCVMRERTPLPARIIDRLHNLRLIITTGQRNRSIDLDAARRRGVIVTPPVIRWMGRKIEWDDFFPKVLSQIRQDGVSRVKGGQDDRGGAVQTPGI